MKGNDIESRFETMQFLENESKLLKNKQITIEGLPKAEPEMSGRLILDEECFAKVTSGKTVKPQMSQDFPASLISTEMEWSDLILRNKTLEEVKEIETWLEHNETLLNDWNMKGIIKPGYRVMFYGPPGTGKTLTASLLGKYTDKDVYRIDLSMVVSKYIGETEKNLSSLFDKAINKDWILFFDEADSIFGKRTNVRDAHDKYANQEVSYLLQRIEAHPGLVILASNFKNNIDTAFTRRFQSIIEFEIPTRVERLRLWQNNLPKNIPLEEDMSLDTLARKYSITGANIVNIIQYACLRTLANQDTRIREEYLIEGIRKEYMKEGKTL
jgi:SpoVK/Ycf46/Vps4 family AAA+-type ATPase